MSEARPRSPSSQSVMDLGGRRLCWRKGNGEGEGEEEADGGQAKQKGAGA